MGFTESFLATEVAQLDNPQLPAQQGSTRSFSSQKQQLQLKLLLVAAFSDLLQVGLEQTHLAADFLLLFLQLASSDFYASLCGFSFQALPSKTSFPLLQRHLLQLSSNSFSKLASQSLLCSLPQLFSQRLLLHLVLYVFAFQTIQFLGSFLQR